MKRGKLDPAIARKAAAKERKKQAARAANHKKYKAVAKAKAASVKQERKKAMYGRIEVDTSHIP